MFTTHNHSLPPPFPQPQQPGFSPVQAPMVYVYEHAGWEYRVLVKQHDQEMPSGQELNAVGVEGWELAGVVSVRQQVLFYFKRPRR